MFCAAVSRFSWLQYASVYIITKKERVLLLSVEWLHTYTEKVEMVCENNGFCGIVETKKKRVDEETA